MKLNEETCAKHLSEMVRYKTISGTRDTVQFEEFYAFHRYLEKTYPRVHKCLKKEVIGRAALLYTWKGTNSQSAQPLLLAAHQDVVDPGDLKGWIFPPFDGVIANGYVWGRGACDCKSNIMAHMEAVELLLAEGFQPCCDIYLAYGWNEEVIGGEENSAALICRVLEERGVRLGLVLDEGKGPGPEPAEGIAKQIATVNICEKGYADIKVSVRGEGGHSMCPGKRSIIAELGQIVVDLSKSQYPYRLTDVVAEEYRRKAEYMEKSGDAFTSIPENVSAVQAIVEENPIIAGKFQTTMALTMLQGSAQANALPTEASVVANCRLLKGDSLKAVIERIKSIVGNRGEVKLLKGVEPSPVSRTDTEGYARFEEVIEEMFPGVPVIPSMALGGTDARNYYPICDTVLRFSGFIVEEDPGVHTSNEHFPIKHIVYGPEFIIHLIKNMG